MPKHSQDFSTLPIRNHARNGLSAAGRWEKLSKGKNIASYTSIQIYLEKYWFQTTFLWMIASNPTKMINFAVADRSAEARSGFCVAGCRHNEKRLSALILDLSKFSQNFILWSRIEQRQMPVDMLTPTLVLLSERKARQWLSFHIQAWASALPSDHSRAMREASTSRTATDTDSYAFPIYKPIYANEGMTAAILSL